MLRLASFLADTARPVYERIAYPFDAKLLS
jgi:hypothetical protein